MYQLHLYFATPIVVGRGILKSTCLRFFTCDMTHLDAVNAKILTQAERSFGDSRGGEPGNLIPIFIQLIEAFRMVARICPNPIPDIPSGALLHFPLSENFPLRSVPGAFPNCGGRISWDIRIFIHAFSPLRFTYAFFQFEKR